MSGDTQPAFRVYSVIPRDGKDDFWLNIGLAFPHGDGKGFNVILQALPLAGKLVLREAAEEEKDTKTLRATRNDRPERRGETKNYKAHASSGQYRR